jgi:hypothetical protein
MAQKHLDNSLSQNVAGKNSRFKNQFPIGKDLNILRQSATSLKKPVFIKVCKERSVNKMGYDDSS